MTASSSTGRVGNGRERVFGAARAFLRRRGRLAAIDVALLVALAGAAFGVVGLARSWTGAYREVVEIDLSFAALPRYALLSLSRALAAYLLSLLFTLAYGYWAAKDRVAARVLIPLLDILQSIPVLGFMPGVVLALVAAFPSSNLGLELAAIVMVFTGQAWNMTFSFYQSLRSVPADLAEVGTLYRFGGWRRLRWIELPFAAPGLVWNSMLSMAGGWFFLVASEAFVLGRHDFRLPGLGAYMSVAAARGDRAAMIASVAAMATLIVLLDQLAWRPLAVWAQRFRLDESGQADTMGSWFIDLLRRSRLAPWIRGRRRRAFRRARATTPRGSALPARARAFASGILLAGLLLLLGWSAIVMVGLLETVRSSDWRDILVGSALTLGRVLVSVALATVWTLPVGIAIGLSPRLSRLLQPSIQVVASFPAPMLFPAVVAALRTANVSLGIGSVGLMLLGAQWYVLFNVVAGATAIPADLREAVLLFRLSRWQRFRRLYLPAVFPYLVTGWITAAGGAWNASIVAEYVSFHGRVLVARGLGSLIGEAAAGARFGVLAAAVTVMSFVVVSFDWAVWGRLHRLAERRFTLGG